MSIHVHVTGADDVAAILQADDGVVLMELLRDESSGVEGVCGGCAACGTCHIVVDDAWIEQLPAIAEEEQALLEALDVDEAGSRLSCQITLNPELDGLALRIVPAEC